jgi:hypothetical protein
MRIVDDLRRGGTTTRDVPRKADADGDENIVDVISGVVEGQADRRRRLPVQHPESEGT